MKHIGKIASLGACYQAKFDGALRISPMIGVAKRTKTSCLTKLAAGPV